MGRPDIKSNEFSFSRVLVLTLIVLFLAFVYFMVRAGYSSQTAGFKNPADAAAMEMTSGNGDYNPADINHKPAGLQAKKGYLVVEDSHDDVSVSLRDSVELCLESMGHVPVYTENPALEEINSGWEGIIITCTYLPEYEIMDALFSYTRSGGFLIFAVRPEVEEIFKSICQQMGIYEHYYYKQCVGFHAEAGLLSDGSYDAQGDWLFNSIIELHVRPQCRVHAVNDDGTPLIWDLDYGKGKMLVMNNSLMTYKSSGGLMLSLIAKVRGTLMYPVVNAKTFALESFPLPCDVNSDYFKSVYLRSGSTFLRELWWPSMARIAAASDIRYTAGILTGYAGEDAYPSTSVLLKDMDFSFYAKEIARYNGELAFTGFNQKPLYFSPLRQGMDFEPWSSKSAAESRTGEALDFLSSSLPLYNFYAFLPTERVLDQSGYELIRDALPSLQVVCGDFTDKSRFYQRFTVDEHGIVNFPVVTSGFIIGDIDRWNLINTVTCQGVISHSGDVSDLMLETNPDNSWNNISQDFADFCSTYIGDMPLDSLTLTQAAERVRDMHNMQAEITYGNKTIDVSVKNMPAKASFMLLCFDGVPENQPGVTCRKIHDCKYLIISETDEFTLRLS